MMKRRGWFRTAVMGVALSVGAGPVVAFVTIGGFADENVVPGSRAPGQLVNSGVARAVERADEIFARNEITATEAPEGVWGTFLPEAIEIVFEDLNNALDLLINALFIRAGAEPPVNIDPSAIPAVKQRADQRDVR